MPILWVHFEGPWAFVTPFGFKITLDYRSKKLKERFWEFVAHVIKITIDYQPKKLEKMLFVTPFGSTIPKKQSNKCSILWSHFETKIWLSRKGWSGGFWEMAGGGSLELLWHLLRLKSLSIIGQKTRKNARYYWRILRKNRFPRWGSFEHMYLSPFGIDFGQTSRKIAWYYKLIST